MKKLFKDKDGNGKHDPANEDVLNLPPEEKARIQEILKKEIVESKKRQETQAYQAKMQALDNELLPPANGNGKATHSHETHAETETEEEADHTGMVKIKQSRLPFHRKPVKPIFYHQVTDQTVNIHATKMLPKTDKLAFIDPKTAEMMPKAIPPLKTLVEHLGTQMPKKSIDPRLLIGGAIAAVMIAISLSIVYSQWIAPADAKEKAFELQLLANAGNQTKIDELLKQRDALTGGSGGGLFQFKPINPFEPPPSKGTAPKPSSTPAPTTTPTPKPTQTQYSASVLAYCQDYKTSGQLTTYNQCLAARKTFEDMQKDQAEKDTG